MKKLAPFIALTLTLLIISKPAVSAPTIKSKINYYLVSGKTANKIRKNINRKTPIHQNGKSYDAYTKWFVKWNYWWDQSKNSCEITKVKTNINIQFTLPKLKITSALPKPLKRKWENYMKALSRHEDGHKQISLRAANEIERKILNMSPRRTCKKLEIDANNIGNKILKKFIRIEKEYDRKNNHGMNDGAIFP